MSIAARLVIGLLILIGAPAGTALATPPFSGTIFIDPDIIAPSDPTTLESVTYAGQGVRLMFDRRVNAFVNYNAYLFNAVYSDSLTIEIQVNPEFGSPANAEIEAEKYAPVFGQLPFALRQGVLTSWIHMGTEPFGGGNHNLLIHTGQSALYEAAGILEETFVHEAAHSSLDASIASAPGWIAAQNADPDFISSYAQANPTTEDVAESVLPYLAVRYRPDRLSQAMVDTIAATIPNRIAYFDSLSMNVHPFMVPPGDCPGDANADASVNGADLSVLLGQFGQGVSPGNGADFNGDAMVNGADLSVLLSAFGTSC